MLIELLIKGAVTLILYGIGVAVTMGAVTARLEEEEHCTNSRRTTVFIVAVALAWPITWLGVGAHFILRVLWDLVCLGFLALVKLGYRLGKE